MGSTVRGAAGLLDLTLEVVKARDLAPGTVLRKVFDSRGGTIGRAPDCAWVLDSSYVSRRHASIVFLEGAFYIESNGLNGVALNSPQMRIPQNERRPLKDGDHLFIDEIEIAVGIAAMAKPAAGDPFADSVPEHPSRDVAELTSPLPDASDPLRGLGLIANATKAAKDAEGQSCALVFVHGFNVTFEEAAIRAAQIGFDLKVQGATAFFSWPSCGKVTKYAADEASIEASESFITDFLIDFAANCGADRIHLMAHSMGNRGLLRGLQRIAARAEEASKPKFEQIVLAAPDVDRDVFIDMASLFARHCTRATLYASGHDLPVFLSKMFHGAPRAGYIPPYTVVRGIDTVEVPNFNVDLLGHSYFAQAEALLHDMFDLMQRDTAPAQRQRVEARSVDGETLWRLRR